MSRSFQFAREFLRDRRQVGAVIPSGQPLAAAVARALGPLDPQQVIIELGPGTGAVTGRLHKSFPDNRLLTVELLPAFARRLEEAFPAVEVIEGDASALAKHIAARGVDGVDVGGIVSSLPLLSLAAETREAIFEALRCVLQPGRRYVQFTYNKRSWGRFMPAGFVLQRSRKVWRNIPPATVLTFART